ncbi:MAG: beta-carotene hydroxylase [Rhodomicrobium sp.]|nr:MAG: beta-carotene hydroxylase [Rhodomicrobium sp.]
MSIGFENYKLADDKESVKIAPTSQQTDCAANKLIRPYQGMVAWPTVVMGFAVAASFITVITLGTLGIIPLWVGLILNSLVLYAAQTPLHEACHGNIAGRDGSKMWLNHLIGYLCGLVLMHEYKAFRHLHLAHHRDTNDEVLDPDHWVKVDNPWLAFFRCATIVFYYNHFFFKTVIFQVQDPAKRKLALHVIAAFWAIYAVIFWVAVMGFWREVLMLWLLPHYIASALIIYFFAYLVHQPHQETDRYRDTNLFLFKGWLSKIVTWAYCYQNYHLIHHLYPRIPFYLYPEAFTDVRPLLEEEHSPIIEIEARQPGLSAQSAE